MPVHINGTQSIIHGLKFSGLFLNLGFPELLSVWKTIEIIIINIV